MKHIFALRRICSTKPCAARSLKDLLSSHGEGRALVEMAVVVPLMLVFITGMMSFGIVLNDYLVLSHAAGVGARYLAVNKGTFTNDAATNPCVMAAAQIKGAAVAILVPGSGNEGVAYSADEPESAPQISYSITLRPAAGGTATTYTSSNGTTGFGSGTACATGGSGNMGSGGGTVTVSVSYPVTPFVMFWTNYSINLTATTTEIIQRHSPENRRI